MRRLTRGGLVVAAVLALGACEKNSSESSPGGATAATGGTEHAQAGTGQAPAQETYYEEAERAVSPQDRAQRDLRGMLDTVMSYYDAHTAVPGSVARTPATIPCGADGAALNAADWQQPSWSALRFTPRDPTHYSYQFDSTPLTDPTTQDVAGATFTATAFGDLDCDGTLSTFVRRGTLRGEGYGGARFSGDNEATITNRDE